MVEILLNVGKYIITRVERGFLMYSINSEIEIVISKHTEKSFLATHTITDISPLYCGTFVSGGWIYEKRYPLKTGRRRSLKC